ncbi:CDP-glycerol glycerophosphotransferase family protein [Bacillus sp. FJAT-49711]|uniref:CDP-glycerol glycerophosphotransferase family protein n=1 Tax=Bacillus sp. FJAT-49711 TaxID=2833585 RepID=UPI001BCA06C4|nr:CDP-glycerol glycerophosphotransferase family protein [Bacillus sp. FJAT-49711]MBS4218965.1 CDP-glycerol glycerophosphotransferase family protein [Bacillus sp. FJAT-49711]
MEKVNVLSYTIKGQYLEIDISCSNENEDQFQEFLYKYRSLKKEIIFKPQKEKISGNILRLKITLSDIPFSDEQNQFLDFFIIINNKKQRLIMRSNRDYSPLEFYKINSSKIAIPYITQKGGLSILYGNASLVLNRLFKSVNESIISGITTNINNTQIIISFSDFTIEDKQYFISLYNRYTNYKNAIKYEILSPTTISIDINKFKDFENGMYDLCLERIDADYLSVSPIHLFYKDIRIRPIITQNENVEFENVNKSEENKKIHVSGTRIDNNKLQLFFEEELFDTNQCQLFIMNKANSKLTVIKDMDSHEKQLSFAVDKTFENNTEMQKWKLLIKIYKNELVEIHELITDIDKKNINSWNAKHDNNDFHIIQYVSHENEIIFFLGDWDSFEKVRYITLKNNMLIRDVDVKNSHLHFVLVNLPISHYERCQVFLKKRKSNHIFFLEANMAEKSGETLVDIDLNNFIEEYSHEVSRWDFYIELVKDNVKELNKIGLFNKPYLPAHKRYYNAIKTETVNVLVPYYTVKNELSITIKTETSLYNEILKANVEVIDFNLKKGIMQGKVNISLSECDNFSVTSFIVKYRSKTDFIEYKGSVTEAKINNYESSVKFILDFSSLSFEQYYWDLYLEVWTSGKKYLVILNNPTEEIKKSISQNTRKYLSKHTDDYLIYPYITVKNTLALTYRKREEHETVLFTIKDAFAYLIFILFKGYFSKNQIWLVYEKFSQTAQDNGYYFFKYLYNNHPNINAYYIIDRNSPDYNNLKGMENKVLHYMSFKHLLYLYAGKLLVSSEAKGHCYILRQQNGRLRNIINNKKAVFLQHGVTALKRVGPTYGKKSKNAVELFVVTSDFESRIIKKYFGYDEKEIIKTGFCRWDALQDKSQESPTKEILLMPTWRSWLDDVSDKKFVESNYYKNYIALLNSKKLDKILNENNVIMNFYIHPKFKAYIDKFSSNNKNIKIYQFGEEKVNELLMKSSLLITDYSSVSWDQYYQKKPIIFYQFDYDDYNQLQGSYLDMESDLFGDRVFDSDSLIDSVESYIENNFAEKEKYAELRNSYFDFVDQKNSERTFNAIIKNRKALELENKPGFLIRVKRYLKKKIKAKAQYKK